MQKCHLHTNSADKIWKKKKNAIQVWGRRINWKRRVKAVCKPCWEIKYCPYGPLVEGFPLQKESDYKTCRIFGHDCPVFYMAEPFTETKDLRNISRSIPRSVQFRVLKRENQICRMCGKSVQDEDIHFDHIIPYSKGGSSDESNIRLLCSNCNLKRKANFEDEYLIASVGDHLQEPVDESIVESIKSTTSFGIPSLSIITFFFLVLYLSLIVSGVYFGLDVTE